jgi:hypothetical protein
MIYTAAVIAYEIAMKLDWPINQIVGRTFELRTFGLVVPDIRRQCRITGMVVRTWRAK